MAAELIISISGMRGLIGVNLTPAIAAEYGCAFGSFLKTQARSGGQKFSVCIGADSRPSGDMLKSAVTAGLTAAGADVIDLGVVSTPGVGIMIRYLNCAGGVVITASHNPVEYNGIKLLLGDGIAPPADIATKIKQRYLNRDFTLTDAINCGKISSYDKTDDVHIEKVLAIVDKAAIRSRKLKVVLDSVNGAGGREGKKLLEQLGCEVVAVNYEPTGLFAHTPEPTADNLTDLCKQVVNNKADIGFAQDPDADRLAIVDQNGRYIGEEYTVALAAGYIFSKNKGKAAVNLSTSRMIDDIAASAGCEVIRTAVGEANVANAMIKNNCVIGGEGNGGVIDLRVGPVRDSLVGIALVLQFMAQERKSIGDLADGLPAYCMKKQKFNADGKQAEVIIKKAMEVFKGAKVNTIDGCRFDFDGGWLHLRTSNTEPVMRAIAEAKTEAVVREYLDTIAQIRKTVL